MKRLLLVLLVIGSSTYAMDSRSRSCATPSLVSCVTPSLTSSDIMKVTAGGVLWTIFAPSVPVIITAAVGTATVYGAYKGGEYLYGRYNKPANANQ